MRALHAMLAMSAIALVAPLSGTAESQTYERWLRVHNETSVDLCYVYISHVNTGRWGRDILGDSCLSPGYYRTVDPGWQQGYCRVDMKFVFDDNDEVTRWNYNICEGTDVWLSGN